MSKKITRNKALETALPFLSSTTTKSYVIRKLCLADYVKFLKRYIPPEKCKLNPTKYQDLINIFKCLMNIVFGFCAGIASQSIKD